MATIEEALAQAVQYHKAGALQQAERIYREILRVAPQHPEALHLLGVIAHQVGQHDVAVSFIQQALAFKPHAADFHTNLGLAYQAMGRLEDAVYCYRQSLHFQPGRIPALANLGDALRQQGRLQEAEQCCQEVLRLRPDLAEAHNNLGVVYREQLRLEEAIACFEQALRLRANFAPARENLDQTRRTLATATAASRPQRQPPAAPAPAVPAPGAPLPQVQALLRSGRVDDALASCEDVLQRQPEHAEAHFCRARIWLLTGDYERGWPEHEWRWRCQGYAPRSFAQPQWDGSTSLQGQTILLYTEQAASDALQMIRYASLLAERGGRVVVECLPELAPLFGSAPGVTAVAVRGAALPSFDVHAPLLSLPGILKTGLATIPATVPYLAADAGRREQWRAKLNRGSGFRIGIVWRGEDEPSSLPLVQLAPLARLPGVQLVSLQRGAGIEQLPELAGYFDVIDPGPALQADSWTFADLAGVLANLDLVVSVDSAAVHLAGALGVPTWLALPFAADWRWLQQREDSPWYPTLRLFRQSQPGDWDSVVWRMAESLFELLMTR